VFIDVQAFGEAIGLEHVDLKQAVDQQVVDLGDLARMLDTQVMHDCWRPLSQ